MGIINNVTMLAIILAGAAVIREREHGTMDHLAGNARPTIRDRHGQSVGQRPRHHGRGRLGAGRRRAHIARDPRRRLGPPVHCRGRTLSLFRDGHRHLSCDVARSMPQLGLLYMLVAMPMNMLSGSNTPLESMPPLLQHSHVRVALDAFRVVRTGDPVSWRWIRRGMEGICGRSRNRIVILRAGRAALPLRRLTGELSHCRAVACSTQSLPRIDFCVGCAWRTR